ncbi:MAG: ExbD/TolR family protein [Desulfomonilia bacterium]|jgi:biopolymer transport protein ExbD
MRFRRNKHKRRIAFIDTTPVVNVVFLLLIFFLLSIGVPYGLKSGSMAGASGTPATGPMTIIVMPDKVLINGKPVSEQVLPGLPRNRDILILASRDISFFKVSSILDVLRTSGHTRLSLATSPVKD